MAQGLYQPLFQACYVTQDHDRATAMFAATQGIEDWLRLPPIRLASIGGGVMEAEIGMTFLGSTMVQVIACKGGNDDLYRQVLPKDSFAVRLHHLGFRLNSEAEWDAMLLLGRHQGYPVAMDIKTATTRALYYDTREALGHYIEYLYYFDEPNSSNSQIPQNFN